MRRGISGRFIVAALLAGALLIGGAARAGKGGKAPPPKAPPSECPPHAHVVVEKDPDEGGTIRRCICDEGWDATGPAPPCAKAPAGAGGKGEKTGKKP